MSRPADCGNIEVKDGGTQAGVAAVKKGSDSGAIVRMRPSFPVVGCGLCREV